MSGHLSTITIAAAPSTLAPGRGASTPASMSPLTRDVEEEDLQLPSTPETFEMARELIENTMPPPLPPQVRGRSTETEAPAPKQRAVPSKEKPVLMSHLLSPRHCSSAPRGTALPWSPGANAPSMNPRRSFTHCKEVGAGTEGDTEVRRWLCFIMPWASQWHVPTQWPFWTPWVFHQAQGPQLTRSLSLVSDSRYHQGRSETVSQPEADAGTKYELEPEQRTNHSTHTGTEPDAKCTARSARRGGAGSHPKERFILIS